MRQSSLQKLSFFMLAFLLPLFTWAQDGTKKLDVDIDVNKGGSSGAGFINNPIVWVIGAAVFILLLVALMRGRRSS